MMEFYLRQIEHGNPDPLHIALNEDAILIGKSVYKKLKKYSKVSSQHAYFVKKGDEWYIRDMNSSHGTYVNRCRIGTQLHGLQIGDHIGFGALDIGNGFVCALSVKRTLKKFEVINLCDDPPTIKSEPDNFFQIQSGIKLPNDTIPGIQEKDSQTNEPIVFHNRQNDETIFSKEKSTTGNCVNYSVLCNSSNVQHKLSSSLLLGNNTRESNSLVANKFGSFNEVHPTSILHDYSNVTNLHSNLNLSEECAEEYIVNTQEETVNVKKQNSNDFNLSLFIEKVNKLTKSYEPCNSSELFCSTHDETSLHDVPLQQVINKEPKEIICGERNPKTFSVSLPSIYQVGMDSTKHVKKRYNSSVEDSFYNLGYKKLQLDSVNDNDSMNSCPKDFNAIDGKCGYLEGLVKYSDSRNSFSNDFNYSNLGSTHFDGSVKDSDTMVQYTNDSFNTQSHKRLNLDTDVNSYSNNLCAPDSFHNVTFSSVNSIENLQNVSERLRNCYSDSVYSSDVASMLKSHAMFSSLPEEKCNETKDSNYLEWGKNDKNVGYSQEEEVIIISDDEAYFDFKSYPIIKQGKDTNEKEQENSFREIRDDSNLSNVFGDTENQGNISLRGADETTKDSKEFIHSRNNNCSSPTYKTSMQLEKFDDFSTSYHSDDSDSSVISNISEPSRKIQKITNEADYDDTFAESRRKSDSTMIYNSSDELEEKEIKKIAIQKSNYIDIFAKSPYKRDSSTSSRNYYKTSPLRCKDDVPESMGKSKNLKKNLSDWKETRQDRFEEKFLPLPDSKSFFKIHDVKSSEVKYSAYDETDVLSSKSMPKTNFDFLQEYRGIPGISSGSKPNENIEENLHESTGDSKWVNNWTIIDSINKPTTCIMSTEESISQIAVVSTPRSSMPEAKSFSSTSKATTVIRLPSTIKEIPLVDSNFSSTSKSTTVTHLPSPIKEIPSVDHKLSPLLLNRKGHQDTGSHQLQKGYPLISENSKLAVSSRSLNVVDENLSMLPNPLQQPVIDPKHLTNTYNNAKSFSSTSKAATVIGLPSTIKATPIVASNFSSTSKTIHVIREIPNVDHNLSPLLNSKSHKDTGSHQLQKGNPLISENTKLAVSSRCLNMVDEDLLMLPNRLQQSVNEDPKQLANTYNKNMEVKTNNNLNYESLSHGLIKIMIGFNLKWLEEQENNNQPPTIVSQGAAYLPLHFKSLKHYVSSFSPLLLLEVWENVYQESKLIWQDEKRLTNRFYFTILSCENRLDVTVYHCEAVVNQLSFRPSEGNLVIMEIKVENNDYYNKHCNRILGFVNSHKIEEINENRLNPEWYRLGSTQLENSQLWKFSVLAKQRPISPIVEQLMKGNGICSIQKYLNLADGLQNLELSPLCKNVLVPHLNSFATLPRSTYSQKEVIERICADIIKYPLNPRIILVQGYPGTGKTETVLSLAEKNIYTVKPIPKTLVTASSDRAMVEIASRLFKKKINQKPMNFTWIAPSHLVTETLKPYSLDEKAAVRMRRLGRSKIKRQKKRLKKVMEIIVRFGEGMRTNVITLNKLMEEKTLLEEQIKNDKEEIDKLSNCDSPEKFKLDVIKESDIVLVSLDGCISAGPLLSSTTFSCCLVDDATQCSEIEILQTVAFRIKKLILIGDLEQLRAIASSKMARSYGYERSIFSRFHQYFFRRRQQSPIFKLTEQFRMHPAIFRFPLKHFYKNVFTNATHIDPQCRKFTLYPYLVFDFLDSSDEEYEAAVVRICHLALSLKQSSSSMGIIVRNLVELSQYPKLKHTNFKSIEINTVEEFQGKEKDVIILLCGISKMSSDSVSFLSCKRKLNVALTRSRRAFIVCMCSRTLELSSDWKDLLQDAKDRNVYKLVQTYKEINTETLRRN